MVWVMTGTGVLKAFDLDGTERWARDIQKDYGRFGLQWGYASSPLLFEDSLYVQVLHGMTHRRPVLRAAHRQGQRQDAVARRAAHARAVRIARRLHHAALLRHAGGTELVITGGDVVTGHDLASGRELWRADGLNPDNDGAYRLVASPVVHGNLLIAPSRERPLLAFRAGGRGDVTRSHLLWSFDRGPDVPTPVTDGTYFYSINDRGIMYCLDAATGKTVYGPQRLRNATYSGSPVLADGKIYITDEDGVTSVVQAGPKFALLAENDLVDYTLSSPAVSDGQIFIRTAAYLYAIGASEEEKKAKGKRQRARMKTGQTSVVPVLVVRRLRSRLARSSRGCARAGGRQQAADEAVRMVADEGPGLSFWPRWRGPSGQGLVQGRGYPDRWSNTENVAWKVAVPGRGQLVADRVGRPDHPDHRLRQRQPLVGARVSPRRRRASCGRRRRPRAGWTTTRTTRTATPRPRRPPTAGASTCRSARGACWRSTWTARSSGTRTWARWRRITAPPGRRCSTRTASSCIRISSAARSSPRSTRAPASSSGGRRARRTPAGARRSPSTWWTTTRSS